MIKCIQQDWKQGNGVKSVYDSTKREVDTERKVEGDVRGWYIAMGQYSSLCKCAAVLTLGVIDIGDGVQGRVQVECGREEVNDGEKQEKDRTRKQPNDDQTHIMDDMKME